MTESTKTAPETPAPDQYIEMLRRTGEKFHFHEEFFGVPCEAQAMSGTEMVFARTPKELRCDVCDATFERKRALEASLIGGGNNAGQISLDGEEVWSNPSGLGHAFIGLRKQLHEEVIIVRSTRRGRLQSLRYLDTPMGPCAGTVSETMQEIERTFQRRATPGIRRHYPILEWYPTDEYELPRPPRRTTL